MAAKRGVGDVGALDRFRMDGAVAVVTGGGGLLGRQHAAALAEIGATVVVTDVDIAAAEEVAREVRREIRNGRVSAHAMDVTSEGSIQRVSAELHTSEGPARVLVNNAAIDPKVREDAEIVATSRLEHFPVAEWEDQLAVGLTGAFLCCKVFGTKMAEARRGSIVNIASDLSVIAPDQRLYQRPDLPADKQPVKPVTYSVIKTGLIGLTRYLATYWAVEGVRVNALSPGGVLGSQPKDFVTRLSSRIPIGRMAAKDEYRCALQFLCSDASSYMTGHNMIVDGGRTIW